MMALERHERSTSANDCFISVRYLKAALETQRNGTYYRLTNPLEWMKLVDDLVNDPAFPPCDHARTIALSIVLNTLITHELIKRRRVFGLNDPTQEDSLDRVIESIKRDAGARNRDLLGWSWLYYHYVRVEMPLTLDMVRTVCFVDERTIRRYQATALQQLTEILVEREWRMAIPVSTSTIRQRG